jgi:hypothetical protein
MPAEVYSHVLTKTHKSLRQHYRHVDSPIEAPGKDTYGDVDILVFGPLEPPVNEQDSPLKEVAARLAVIIHAKTYIVEKENPTMNFAIPWPNSIEDSDIPSGSTSNSEAQEAQATTEAKYIQLDIKICPTLRVFNWELFHAAHGDLWNILGSTIRKFGLTVNNLGMYLRIPEIELFDRKKSMVFVTDEPGAILRFLGLEEERWWTPFEGREEMFAYAAGCRMFWVKDADDDDDVEHGEIEGQEGGEKGKKKLKHNDRQRMSKRPIFKEWMDEFIPRCRDQGKYKPTSRVTREQICCEVFKTFGSEVEITYDTRLKEWKLAKHQDEIWREVIKNSVPADEDLVFRSASLRTLKSVIMEGEEFEGAIPSSVERDAEGFWDASAVKDFVVGNWRRAGEIGMARQEQRALEAMKAKAEKKARVMQEEEEGRKKVKVDDS